MSDVLVSMRHVTVRHRLREGLVPAVEDVSLDILRDEVVALIGESGCGKSTLTSTLLGLGAMNSVIDPASRILWEDENILEFAPERLRQFRWVKASLIFQAAQNALNPTITLEEQFRDTLIDHGASRGRTLDRERIAGLLDMVRLDAGRVLPAYPHQLSGGMRQRAIIALALVLDPQLLILDEPTTALDTITQHYVFDILREAQARTHASMLLVTHDLGSAAKLADRVGVMYAGQLVEIGPSADVFREARHPYAAALVSAMPSIEGDVNRYRPIPGSTPDVFSRPEGCLFQPRCTRSLDRCREERPVLEEKLPGRRAACWLEDL